LGQKLKTELFEDSVCSGWNFLKPFLTVVGVSVYVEAIPCSGWNFLKPFLAARAIVYVEAIPCSGWNFLKVFLAVAGFFFF